MSLSSVPQMRLRSGDRLLLVVMLLLIFIMAARTPLDSDLWWHLRAGQQTVQTGQPVLADTFSYTRAGQGWINHSWLGQVLLYLVYRAAGFAGLSAWVAGLAAVSMALVMLQMDCPMWLRAFIALLSTLVAALVWSPRPQIVSLVLLALLGWLLYRFKQRRFDRLWLLPLIFCLWANLHGGYLLGFLLIAALLGGEVINRLLGAAPEDLIEWPRLRRLLVWTLAAVFALLLNPNGLNIWRIPFQTVGVEVLQRFINEWASPNFHDINQQPMLWLLLACLAALGLSGKRADGYDVLVLLLFGAMALIARRNFGPFALTAAPVLARHVWPIWQRLPFARALPSSGSGARIRGLNLAIVALLGLAAVLKVSVVSHPVLVNGALRASYPAAAVDWLQANRPEGRMLASYGWGGYLIWALPEYPVFVDGRTDLFGDEIIGQWMQVVQGEDGWQQVLQRWDVRLLLLEPNRPLVRLLPEQGWKLLYSDTVSVLYGR